MFCDMTLPKGTLETGQQNAARVQQRVGWRSEPPLYRVRIAEGARPPVSILVRLWTDPDLVSQTLGACLKRGDLEHIRSTGKPIIETINGVTREVDADHHSPLWRDHKLEKDQSAPLE
jgi:hypothetical protein